MSITSKERLLKMESQKIQVHNKEPKEEPVGVLKMNLALYYEKTTSFKKPIGDTLRLVITEEKKVFEKGKNKVKISLGIIKLG